jgi:hypothetical protein
VSEGIVPQLRPHLLPEYGGVGQFVRFEFRTNRLQSGRHRLQRGAVVVVGGRFAVTAQPVFLQFHDQRRLHIDRAASNGEGVTEGEMEAMEAKLHKRPMSATPLATDVPDVKNVHS